ncbi:MAG TPA: response regulator, partial [Anaerolineae bacterium]|nr:response regulator [Anaerolineae bacterium]
MSVVLIVDDNTAVRAVVADYLAYKFPDWKILQAEDGVEGITLTQLEKPNLILMDADMPYMNGYEAAQKLRQSPDTKQIPIIAISGGSSNVASDLYVLSDAALPKPFSADELWETIEYVLQ